jgi:hypothetical protein
MLLPAHQFDKLPRPRLASTDGLHVIEEGHARQESLDAASQKFAIGADKLARRFVRHADVIGLVHNEDGLADAAESRLDLAQVIASPVAHVARFLDQTVQLRPQLLRRMTEPEALAPDDKGCLARRALPGVPAALRTPVQPQRQIERQEKKDGLPLDAHAERVGYKCGEAPLWQAPNVVLCGGQGATKLLLVVHTVATPRTVSMMED